MDRLDLASEPAWVRTHVRADVTDAVADVLAAPTLSGVGVGGEGLAWAAATAATGGVVWWAVGGFLATVVAGSLAVAAARREAVRSADRRLARAGAEEAVARLRRLAGAGDGEARDFLAVGRGLALELAALGRRVEVGVAGGGDVWARRRSDGPLHADPVLRACVARVQMAEGDPS